MKKKIKKTDQPNIEKKQEQPPLEKTRPSGLNVKSQLSPGEHVAGGDGQPHFP